MALIKQIFQIVNDSYKDAIGNNAALTNIDTSTLVSMGQTLEKYDLYESFYKALANRIVKTVYFVRGYNPRSRSVLRDEHEFGAFVQKVYYKSIDAVDSAPYAVTTDAQNYAQKSPYDVETVVPVESKIFGGQGVFDHEFIRPVVQLKTAFTSDAEMLAFISGLYMAVDNRIAKEIETLEDLAVSTAIADTIQSGNKRNLLKEYNDGHVESTLTVAQALESLDFLKFASKEINQTIKFMKNLSTAFNSAKYETYTPEENMVVEVLTHFASSANFYLQSDTFHNNLTSLPRYEEVPYWQGQDATQSFGVCSGIDITNDGINAGTEVKQAGIIAFVHDTENVACYFGSRRSWEMYNPRSEVMIHGEHANKGYAVDNHANAVVFYIAEEEAV